MNRKSKAAEFLLQDYNISVTGRNVLVTDAMKDYAIEKVSKMERFSHRIIDVLITMEIQKLDHRVDIVLKVDNVKIKSHASTDNIYASVDKAVDRLEAQLLKYKARINNHHQLKDVTTVDRNVNILRPGDEEVLDVNIEIEEENQRRLMDKFQPHQIVTRETRSIKTLSDGEAIVKMSLSPDTFLIYRGEENQKIKVMYLRNDGDYGVIETEI